MTDAKKVREIAKAISDADNRFIAAGMELLSIADLLEAVPPEVLKALKAGTRKAVPVEPNEMSAVSMVASDHDWITYSYFVCCRRCGIVRRADGKNSPCKGNVRIITRTEATLEKLLRMTVHVGPGCVAPEGTQMSPEFRLSIQEITDDGVRFIIHANGHDSDTMDLIVRGNSIMLAAAPKPKKRVR